mmetsp:Transcript_4281/g.7139  ORF Transcript_4281/g.7139 Transcript_4281/m.7139 type:complete len:252 (+) Transcript_4281:86-841(+)|eukprot:CAMPEP_0119015996 /NCGR_PEP_ID=MMETSP1176-20130426/11761_1 /TAXON_ID=265551 /ORGANISM="Synedropsis recta cf, Strain CCMP1620" /LENGTH=251 /DNA_ID=CAMNT_0006969321 /DNA_START=52 /DNA_END=807 /DNA_ORIENTATION=+
MNLTFLLLLASLAASDAAAFSPNSPSSSTTRSPTELGSSTTDDTPMFDEFVDEAALLKQSTFPIQPAALMKRAKEILAADCGIGTKDGGACLAPDFEFCAAVVGPIGREEYLGALGSFSLEEAFDITPNFFGMTVDPIQPNRVWFFNRVQGIHKGTFMGAKASGKEIVYPPQILHIDLDEQGLVREFGFYTADRRQGNTGGLGGAFGFMYGVGKPLPIPECRPFKRSLQFRLLSKVGNLAQKLSRKKEKKE